MLCPHCNEKLKCIDTVHVDDKGRTLRKYSCNKCNVFFYSKEDILDDRDLEFFTDWYKWWRYKIANKKNTKPKKDSWLDCKVKSVFD